MRITSLWIKRPFLNRLSYWVYEKFCNEPYFPEGEVKAYLKIGNPECLGFDGRESSVRLVFIPKRFVPGIHEVSIDIK